MDNDQFFVLLNVHFVHFSNIVRLSTHDVLART